MVGQLESLMEKFPPPSSLYGQNAVLCSHPTHLLWTRKIFMINSNDDIRYCQDVFGSLPVADIVKRRTTLFSNKYRAVNYNNIVCQACVRR